MDRISAQFGKEPVVFAVLPAEGFAMKWALCAGMCSLICSPLFAGDKYALLIGVSKYEHAEMNKPDQLRFPEEDAKALGELLKKGGYEVEVLLGKNATHEAVEKKLAGLTRKGTSEGVVVIGLFGHGVEIETRDDRNNIVMDGCFCPFDTELRIARNAKGLPLRNGNGDPLTEPVPTSLIRLSDLMLNLKVAKAGNRVVLADCCRTVPNQARGRSFGAGFRAQDLPDNTSVVFGCSPNEKAFEHPDWGHGAFTKCLLEAMAELSSNGRVSTARLADSLKEKVPELVKTVAPRDHQVPKLFSTDSVDLQLTLLGFSRSKPPLSSKPSESIATYDRSFEGTEVGYRRELVPGIYFRWCPAGTFTMGSPKSERGRGDDEDPASVTLTKGFWLGETEVTQGQWQKLMKTTPWKGVQYVKEGVNFAASYISHDDANQLIEKLTAQERNSGKLPKGWKYSLPTEAQWEYACRAGSETTFSFGSDETKLGEFGWFAENADKIKEEYAHEVGLKKANAWGLKDMHGNVWEWCSGWYDAKLAGGPDPQGPSFGSFRVIRGGSWSFNAVYCRSAYRLRGGFLPANRRNGLGFRLAAVPE